MRYGDTLVRSEFAPWKDKYIDYAKLKNLLREEEEDNSAWTEDDENRFIDEILNVQLEKVADFQSSTFKALEQRATKAGEKLQQLAPEDGSTTKGDITTARFKEIEDELESIIDGTRELQKYGSMNYTAFLKIVKKHDRKRGHSYKIRPMFQTALFKKPFHSASMYSQLLNKLSALFFVVRQQLDETPETAAPMSDEAQSESLRGKRYTAHKFWVHQDDLMEAKTYIIRRLPSLVFSSQSQDVSEAMNDPTVNSLYFDNAQFSLYANKVNGEAEASSIRIRWYGQLKSNPELYIELKIVLENGSSEERLLPIKEKYVQRFIKGEYGMEKSIRKMEKHGQTAAQIEAYKKMVEEIQSFIKENKLQPVLRANYTRTAYQKPLDDRVRIALDSNLVFIREDSFDDRHPCRDPDSWHRSDVDVDTMAFPFSNIKAAEISRFPYSILEIKIKEDKHKKVPQWIGDLMASHLVHKIPRFSKFIQGGASLYEDNVNDFPPWHSLVETDIRTDPQTAFEQEEDRKAKQLANAQVVGSFFPSSHRASFSHALAVQNSPLAKSNIQSRLAAEESMARNSSLRRLSGATPPTAVAEGGKTAYLAAEPPNSYGTMASVLPSFSLPKYGKTRRGSIKLPPGVMHPGQLIKDSGPLQVEPKVWLANERTFLKWQHICVLLGSLALSLYSAGGYFHDTVAEIMGTTYVVIAMFAGVWGYSMHRTRRSMIVERSGKDFDNMIGPVIVCLAMMVALVANFVMAYRQALDRYYEEDVLEAQSRLHGLAEPGPSSRRVHLL